MSTPPPSRPATRWLAWSIFIAVVTAVAVIARTPGSGGRDETRAEERAEREGEAARAAIERAHATPPHPPPLPALPRPPAPPTPPSAPRVAGDQRTETRSYPVPSSGRFSLSVDSGDVTLVASSSRELELQVTSDSAEPLTWRELTRDDGTLAIELESGEAPASGLGHLARILSGGGISRHAGIDRVRVSLPSGVATHVETGAGDVAATALAGGLHVETGAGDVTVARMADAVHVESGAGDVTLTDVTGDAHVETGAGDVDVSGTPDDLEVESGAGSVKVTGRPGRADLQTGMGDIRVRAERLDERMSASTGFGEIELVVVSGGFQLEAESGVANVLIEADGRTTRSEGMGGEVARTIGGGGPTVRLESGAGAITVRALHSGGSAPARPAGTSTASAAPPTSGAPAQREPALASSP